MLTREHLDSARRERPVKTLDRALELLCRSLSVRAVAASIREQPRA